MVEHRSGWSLRDFHGVTSFFVFGWEKGDLDASTKGETRKTTSLLLPTTFILAH